MKYLLLICADPTIEPDEVGDINEWFEEIAKRGARLDGDRLQPPDAEPAYSCCSSWERCCLPPGTLCAPQMRADPHIRCGSCLNNNR